MTTGRTERARETVVWSVSFVSPSPADLTIISGDSRGKTCFWNGQLGTLVDAYQTHKADVLAVAAKGDGTGALSSGVDPVTMHFQPVQRGEAFKWVKTVHRSVHTHDVRAIVTDAANSRTFSAGLDALLALDDAKGKTVTKYAPLPHGKCVSVARGARRMLRAIFLMTERRRRSATRCFSVPCSPAR